MKFLLAAVSPSDLGSRHVSGSIVPIAATITCLLLLAWQRQLVVRLALGLLRRGRAVHRRESARQTVLTATEVIKQQLPAVSVMYSTAAKNIICRIHDQLGRGFQPRR